MRAALVLAPWCVSGQLAAESVDALRVRHEQVVHAGDSGAALTDEYADTATLLMYNAHNQGLTVYHGKEGIAAAHAGLFASMAPGKVAVQGSDVRATPARVWSAWSEASSNYTGATDTLVLGGDGKVRYHTMSFDYEGSAPPANHSSNSYSPVLSAATNTTLGTWYGNGFGAKNIPQIVGTYAADAVLLTHDLSTGASRQFTGHAELTAWFKEFLPLFGCDPTTVDFDHVSVPQHWAEDNMLWISWAAPALGFEWGTDTFVMDPADGTKVKYQSITYATNGQPLGCVHEPQVTALEERQSDAFAAEDSAAIVADYADDATLLMYNANGQQLTVYHGRDGVQAAYDSIFASLDAEQAAESHIADTRTGPARVWSAWNEASSDYSGATDTLVLDAYGKVKYNTLSFNYAGDAAPAAHESNSYSPVLSAATNTTLGTWYGNGFGAKNVAQIVGTYAADAVLLTHDLRTGASRQFTGHAELTAWFQEFLPLFGCDPTTVDFDHVSVPQHWAEDNMLWISWAAPALGFEWGTDTFVMDPADGTKVKYQSITYQTTGAPLGCVPESAVVALDGRHEAAFAAEDSTAIAGEYAEDATLLYYNAANQQLTLYHGKEGVAAAYDGVFASLDAAHAAAQPRAVDRAAGPGRVWSSWAEPASNYTAVTNTLVLGPYGKVRYNTMSVNYKGAAAPAAHTSNGYDAVLSAATNTTLNTWYGNGFGAKDVAQIVSTYAEDAVLLTHDMRTGATRHHEGHAQLTAWFTEFLPTFGCNPSSVDFDLVSVPKYWAEENMLWLSWAAPALGYVWGTDTFVMDPADGTKVKYQSITYQTSGPLPECPAVPTPTVATPPPTAAGGANVQDVGQEVAGAQGVAGGVNTALAVALSAVSSAILATSA